MGPGIGEARTHTERASQIMSIALSNKVTPQCYDLKLEIDPKKENFKGELTIDLSLNDKDDTVFDHFILHGDQLVVTHADINNSIELKVTYDHEKQHVIFTNENLSELLHALTVPIALNLSYIGKITTVESHEGKTKGLFKIIQNGNTLFSTHAQPSFARLILPCVDEPSIKTYFQLTLKTLSQFESLSVAPIESTTNEGKWKVTTFEKSILLPVALFGFTIGDIKSIKVVTKDDKIPISIWAMKHENVDLATYALNVVSKYLPLVQSIFQFKFPGKKLDIVILPFLNDIVMENFSMITVHKQLVLLSSRELATREITFQTMQMLVHELVHHWVGNFITFDSWTHLWFNEAFATWLANHLIATNESDYADLWDRDAFYWDTSLKPVMESDSYIETPSIVKLQESKAKDSSNTSATNELFDPHCYNKGIVILRDMQLTIGMDHLSTAFKRIFNENIDLIHNKCIKPMDLWKLISDKLKSENIINYFVSWTMLPGLPIISVTTDDRNDEKNIKLVQHRFLPSSVTSEQEMFEDVPFHVPLLGQLTDGTRDEQNTIMTDRSMILNYDITLLNKDNQSNVIISYEREESYDEFLKMITLGTMKDHDLFKIFYDLNLIVGNVNYQKSIHIDGFFKILNHIGSLKEDITFISLNYWKSLREGMKLLEFLTRFYTFNQDTVKLDKIAKITNKLFHKFSWDIKWVNDYGNEDELVIRSSLLFLTRATDETYDICHKIFQYLKTGQDKDLAKMTIPIMIVSSVYKCMVSHAENVKDWKAVLDMHKASVIEKIVNGNRVEGIPSVDTTSLLTNHAMESVGFITGGKPELLDRVLNFIASNITEPYVDSVFMGLIYQSSVKISDDKTFADEIWELFTKQHKHWIKKLDEESIYFIEFWLIQMWILHGKTVAEKELMETVEEVNEDVITLKMRALQLL